MVYIRSGPWPAVPARLKRTPAPCRPRGRAHQRRVGVHAADDTRGRSVTAPSDGERLDARGTRIRCICPRYTVVRPADDDRNRCGNISAFRSVRRLSSIVRREVGIRFLEDPVTLKGPLRSFVFPKPFARKLERASQAQNADLRPLARIDSAVRLMARS